MVRLLVFKLLIVILLATFQCHQSSASQSDNGQMNTYTQSDEEINNFLKEFIRRSVDNVVFFWEFIIKLVRNILGDPNSKNWPD